jgi:hypothetical protein
LHESDVFFGERHRFAAHDDDDADQVLLSQNRHAEHRPVRTRPGVLVLRIGLDIGDVNGLTQDSGSASRRRSIEAVRMLSVVFRRFGPCVVRHGYKEISFEEPECPMVGGAQPSARLGDLLEHGLQAIATSDRSQDCADRVLLLAQRLELTHELGGVVLGGRVGHET